MEEPLTLMFKPGDKVIHSTRGKCVVKNVTVNDLFNSINYYILPKEGEPFWSWGCFLRSAKSHPDWDREDI